MEKTVRLVVMVLYLMLVVCLLYSLKEAGWVHTSQVNSEILQYNHAKRVSGKDLMSFQKNVAGFIYGERWDKRPDVVVIAPNDDWREAMRGLSLCAWPSNNFLLIDDLKKPSRAFLKLVNLQPKGIIYRGELVHVISMTPLRGEVQEALIKEGYNPIEASGPDYYILMSLFKLKPATAIISDGKDARFNAFTASFTSYTGAPVIFTQNGSIDPIGLQWITGLGLHNVVWVGRRGMPEEVRAGLRKFNLNVLQMTGGDPDKLAVRWAKTFYPKLNFGWRADSTGDQGWRNFYIAPEENWVEAISGAQLARQGQAGPILWANKGCLSPVVENYLWQRKPNYLLTPTEGPYFQAWVLGSVREISSSTQSKLNYIGQIVDYATHNGLELSGLGALGLAWLLLTVSCSIWVGLHIFRRTPEVSHVSRWVWMMATLLSGPLGMGLYLIYIRGAGTKRGSKDPSNRAGSLNILFVSIHIFSFAATILLLMDFLFALCGQPMFILSGWFSWLGSPRFLAMAISFFMVLAIQVFILFPYLIKQKKGYRYQGSVKRAFLPALISTIAFFAGYFTLMGSFYSSDTMKMINIAHPLWWSFRLLAVLAGFFITWAVNFLPKYFNEIRGEQL